ncbi:MAG: ArnT family glycosyltransferase [Planctomycetota bacterium]|jgi:hypothetical protein
MSDTQTDNRRLDLLALGVKLLLFAALSIVGVTWGLPSRNIDKYLFGNNEVWPGEKIYRLAGADAKFSPDRGADVDVDPLRKTDDKPILLTATEEDVAKIYLRYRLYTYQPDEMITMMALAGMKPGRLDLDPRLYQYGGLFIYPVGALIKLCGMLGLIDVRSDVVYYLDNPEESGKFYIVARAYAAAWGLLGVYVVFAIGRRLGGSRAGLLAALLFTFMPVVVCMAHEGKPHLPGAVIMLLAVLFAMRHLSVRAAGFPGAPGREASDANGIPPESGNPRGLPIDRDSIPPAAHHDVDKEQTSRNWWLMCVCCGAAFGMVLSSWPIFVLIPLVALLDKRARADDPNPNRGVPARRERVGRPRAGAWGSDKRYMFVSRALAGVGVAVAVYLITNPYIVINAFINREVLHSNFGNSLAMYEISRIGEGFMRVIELTGEGATWPILILGVIALILGMTRKNAAMLPLAVSAAVFFVQFVLIGAGKPAEYGRFGIFTNTALAIGVSCLLAHRWGRFPITLNAVAAALVVMWTAFCGGAYLRNFQMDTTGNNSRTRLAAAIARSADATEGEGDTLLIGVLADPAPYGCPPMDFSRIDVVLLRSPGQLGPHYSDRRRALIYPTDRRERTLADTLGEMFPRARGYQRPARDTPISWANKPFRKYWPDWFTSPPAARHRLRAR